MFMSLALWMVAFFCVIAIVICVMQAPRGQTRYINPTAKEPRRKKATIHAGKPGAGSSDPVQQTAYQAPVQPGYQAPALTAHQAPVQAAYQAPLAAHQARMQAAHQAPVQAAHQAPVQAIQTGPQPQSLLAQMHSPMPAPQPQPEVKQQPDVIEIPGSTETLAEVSAVIQAIAAPSSPQTTGDIQPVLQALLASFAPATSIPDHVRRGSVSEEASAQSGRQSVPMPVRQVFIPREEPVFQPQQLPLQEDAPVQKQPPAPLPAPASQKVEAAAVVPAAPSAGNTLQNIPAPRTRNKSTLSHMLNKAIADRTS